MPYLRVAAVQDIRPGGTLRVEPGRRPILLARVAGAIYACDDTCAHEDSSLSLGCLKGELVKCTLHGSWFNVRTGMPTAEPATEPLRTYPVRLADGDVYIRLAPD